MQVPLVRPDSVSVVPRSLAVSCVKDEHLVNLSVTVPVVVSEVYAFVNSLAGVHNHFAECSVVVVLSVCRFAVVCISVRQSYRAGDVEVELKLSVALCLEVVFHTTVEVELFEAFFVGNALIECRSMVGPEFCVGKLHEYDKTFFHTNVWLVVASERASCLYVVLAAACRLPHLVGSCGHCLHVGKLVKACSVVLY